MTKLYDATNHILIHAEYNNPVIHRHMAAHIIISMGNTMCVVANDELFQCHGIMIPSGTPHTVNTYGNPVLVFLYDCTTDIANQIQSIQCISGECCQNIVASYADMEQSYTTDNYCHFVEAVLSQLGLVGTTPRVKDERIISAMKHIQSMSSEQLSCQEVADTVYLSQSRFSHLFKEQVGMTFASYLIYQRIMYVYAQAFRGKTITEAALEAGFSSSAHFADVNRRVFGLSASTLTRNLVFVKIQ